MHDINFIRQNPDLFDQEMKRRGEVEISQKIIELDKIIRESKTEGQKILQEKNKIAKKIGICKSQKKDVSELLKEAEKIKNKIIELEKASPEEQELKNILVRLPNILQEDIPLGDDEEDNKEISSWGEIPTFSYQVKNHTELGEDLGMMDFERTAIISGTRFVTLKKDLAKLERALANFMLDIHINEYGLEEISPPLLVNEQSLYGTGQLPKFAEDAFVTTDNKWLISTSEIPLTNIVREKTLDISELPLRFCAYTPCFRSEAGSAGKDTKGMMRLHQFNKVEMVSITHPNKSEEEHQRMLKIAENILQKLKLPYKVVLLCSGDTGFTASKTYDLEVWLPSQNKYREISSISNCKDFQSRRMKAKFKDKKIHFLHSLNGSGLAVGRTLLAILENYQNKDGSITVPELLIPYMSNKKEICKKT